MYGRFAFLGALFLAATLAACGGGGGGGGGGGILPTSTPIQTATPAGPTVSVTLGSSPTTGPLPVATSDAGSALYAGGTLTLPSGSGSGTVVATADANVDTSTLDIAHMRNVSNPKFTTRVHAADSGTPFTTLAYFTFTASSATTLNGLPGVSITLDSAPSGPYYLAAYDTGSQYWYPVGSFTTSGDTISIAATTTPVLTIAAHSSLYLAVYTSASGSPIPNPNPYGCVGVQPDTATLAGRAHSDAVTVQPTAGTYTYAGTYAETIARFSPCPMPTATSSATVAVTVTTSPGSAGQVYENSTETDTYPTDTVTTNTSALVEATTVPGGSTTALGELNETTTDEVNDSTTTTYTTPLIVGVTDIPYSGTYTNGTPSTVVGTLADGSTTSRTYGSSGAYTENDTIAGISGENTITVNADGSASYLIQTPNFSSGGVDALEYAFSAPSGGTITVNTTLNPGAGQSTQSPLTIPVWWSGSSLYSDSTTGAAATALPAQCINSATATALLGGINSFARTVKTIDPALGYTDTMTATSYVAENYNTAGPVGPVCVVISDTQNMYYDFLLDTPYSLFVTNDGNPLQTDTINESYWFDPANPPSGYTRVRTQSTAPGNIPGLAASISAHESGIAFRRAVQRTQRIERFAKGITSARHIGGVK